jgi:hypothetical protein
VWSEAETKLLIQVEEELQGTKNINIAIDEILKSKTAKQISNKRNTAIVFAFLMLGCLNLSCCDRPVFFEKVLSHFSHWNVGIVTFIGS